MKIQGHYLNGKISNRSNAHLEILPSDNNTVCITVNDAINPSEQLYFDYNQVQIESRLGDTPREIIFPDGQLFITDDNAGIDQFAAYQNNRAPSAWLYKLESNFSMILASTILAAVIVWVLISQGIPVAAKTIAFKMPEIASNHFVDPLTIFDKTLFDPSQLEATKQQEVREFLAPYLAEFEDLNPTIVFRALGAANAFALPSGVIVFTDEFIHLAENNEQLLSVFFHEIGHFQHKHLIRRALQDSMITLLVVLVTGDLDSIDMLTGLPTLLMDLAYSRQFETEADHFALEQLQRYDIPALNFANIMRNLDNHYSSKNGSKNLPVNEPKEKSLIPDYFSTHPPTAERLKLIEEY